MTREEFSALVTRTLEDVVLLAEQRSGRKLSRRLAFQ